MTTDNRTTPVALEPPAVPRQAMENRGQISYATLLRQSVEDYRIRAEALRAMTTSKRAARQAELTADAYAELARLIERAETLHRMELREPWDGRPIRATYAQFVADLVAGFSTASHSHSGDVREGR